MEKKCTRKHQIQGLFSIVPVKIFYKINFQIYQSLRTDLFIIIFSEQTTKIQQTFAIIQLQIATRPLNEITI